MATGDGTSTITFPVSAQSAQIESSIITTDVPPAPNVLYKSSPPTQVTTWLGPVYGNGVWVAVNQNTNTTMRSTDDGVTWIAGGNLTTTTTWTNVVFSGTSFIVCSNPGGTSNISTNGSTWSAGGNPGAAALTTLVVSGSNIVGTAGTGLVATYSNNNGSTWNATSMPVSATWNAMAVNGNIVVAAANSVTNSAVSLDNGQTWSAGGALPGAQTWKFMVYTGTAFVCISTTQFVCYSLDNGTTWFLGTSIPGSLTVNGAYYKPNEVIVHASSQNTLFSSVDNGITWGFYNSEVITGGTSGVGYHTGTFLSLPNTLGCCGRATNVIVRTLTNKNTTLKPAVTKVGTNISSVTVTGQTGLLSTDCIDAWIQANDSTASHTAYEHKIAPIKLSIMNIVAGVGFDIVAISEYRLDGDFKVRWAWAT